MDGTKPLENLPDRARIWIYQTARALSDQEITAIDQELTSFCASWQAHGKHVYAAGAVIDAHFIVIGADEDVAAVTGCSIDSSVTFVKMLGKRYDRDFFDRTSVAVRSDLGIRFTDFRSLADDPEMSADSTIYDNTVKTVGEWRQAWIKPASESWLSRFLPSKV